MARLSFVIFGVFAAMMAAASAQSSITFTLFGTAWTNCDDLSDCDLFVKILCSNGGSWTECGKTEKQQDDNNPVWDEVFTLGHIPGTNQRWKFEVWNADVIKDDLIVTHDISVDAYNENSGNLYQLQSDLGILWIQRRR